MARRAKSPILVVSCEHASDRVPARYAAAFSSSRARRALSSHRGIDFGARSIARLLSERLDAPYFEGTMTRLLVDLNRSPGHPRLFSEYSRGLPVPLLEELRVHHRAYRNELLERLSREKSSILHLSVHSFTPIFDGAERRTEVGALYDPSRPEERKWGQHLKRAFGEGLGLIAHANQPYRGVSDGVATWLRRQLGERYVGLELEFNQRLVGPICPPKVARGYVECLVRAIDGFPG